jgi:hypothetical protein
MLYWYHWYVVLILLIYCTDITDMLYWYHWYVVLISLICCTDITDMLYWYHWYVVLILLICCTDITDMLYWYHWYVVLILQNKNSYDVAGFPFSISSDYHITATDKYTRLYSTSSETHESRWGLVCKFVYGVILQHPFGSSINADVNQ